MPKNSTDESKSHKIYMYMVHMYFNESIARRDFGENSQLTNSILDLGATFHIAPDILDLYQDH